MYIGTISLRHQNDWTEITEDICLNMRSSLAVSNPSIDTNFEDFVFNAPSKDIAFHLIRTIKKHKNIYKIVSFKRIGRMTYEMSFLGSYSNSIRKIMLDNGIMVKFLIVYDGLEKYSFIAPEWINWDNLKGELRGVARIYDLDVKRVNSTTSSDLMSLSLEDEETLLLAFKRGFFDEPRKVDLNGLASELGLSKSTVNSKIKKGIRKILSVYFSGISAKDVK
ncbi:helix-turn-helix domain-containing protein [Candidatus Acidianus copahuensis]|nr:helix-turn-helix domain-containing protein [Candidatus Acidianus copahuensis]